MVAFKIIFAVALVSVAIVQINGKPTEMKDQVSEWTAPFEALFKNINQTVSNIVNEKSTKSGLNTFAENLKSELSSLSKSLESKSGVSDMVKEATKQWHQTVETYSKNIPEELNVKKINEKFEETLKHITQNASELSKKAQGNVEVEKTVQEFAKKQIDGFMELLKTVQSQVNEKKD